MDQSPLVEILAAIDKLDAESVAAMCAPTCQMTMVDGRQANGREEVRQLLGTFLSQIRSTRHEITSEWHIDDTWIAEVLAAYEMRDWLRIEGLPRAFFLRTGAEGIQDLRAYGANEHRMDVRPTGNETMRVSGHTVLPL